MQNNSLLYCCRQATFKEDQTHPHCFAISPLSSGPYLVAWWQKHKGQFFLAYFGAKSLRKLELSYCSMVMVVYRQHDAALGDIKREHWSIWWCRASCISADSQYGAQGNKHVLHTVGR